MQTIRNLPTFIFGAIAAFLICSLALNIFFYSGKLSASHSAFCDGYYAGAENVVKGIK